MNDDPLFSLQVPPLTIPYLRTVGARSHRAIPTNIRSVAPAARTMLEIFLTTTLALATLTAIVRPSTNGDLLTGPAMYRSTAADKNRWDLAAREFADMGIDVQPFNANQPNLLAGLVRPGVLLDRRAANQLAVCAHKMLGPDSLVTLRDYSDRVLAIAFHSKRH